jgi:hypothetical protein
MWYGTISGGNSGTTITATVTGGNTGDGLIVQYAEISGITQTSPIDVVASNAQASIVATTVATTTSIATSTNTGDIIFGWCTIAESGPSVTPSTTFTNSFTNINVNSVSGSIVLGSGLAYFVPGSTGSWATAENFTSAFPITQYGQSIIVAMLPDTGGGGGGGNTVIGRRRIICLMT